MQKLILVLFASIAVAKLSSKPPGAAKEKTYSAPIAGAAKACFIGGEGTGIDESLPKDLENEANALAAAAKIHVAKPADIRTHFITNQGRSPLKCTSDRAEAFFDPDSCCLVLVDKAGGDMHGSKAAKAALLAHESDHAKVQRRWGKKGKGRAGLKKWLACHNGSLGQAHFFTGAHLLDMWCDYVEVSGHTAGLKAAKGNNGSTPAEKQAAAKDQASGLSSQLGSLCGKIKKAKADPNFKADPASADADIKAFGELLRDIEKCVTDGKAALKDYNDNSPAADKVGGK